MTTNADMLANGFSIFDEEVERILAGRSHDNALPLGFTVPVPARADVRLFAARLASLLLFQLSLRQDMTFDLFNGPFFRTTVISKLLLHLSDTGADTPEKVARFAPHMSLFATAICEAPDLLDRTNNFSQILRAHCRRAARKLRRINTMAGPKVHNRKAVWNGDDGFALEEVADPRHLLIDNAVLRHSIGRCYDTDAMAELGITLDHPTACFFLVSWRAIKKGEARVFTLTKRGIPRAALLYDVRQKIIAEVRSDLMPFTYDHELYWPLTNAMQALRDVVPVTLIDTHPWTPADRNPQAAL